MGNRSYSVENYNQETNRTIKLARKFYKNGKKWLFKNIFKYSAMIQNNS